MYKVIVKPTYVLFQVSYLIINNSVAGIAGSYLLIDPNKERIATERALYGEARLEHAHTPRSPSMLNVIAWLSLPEKPQTTAVV